MFFTGEQIEAKDFLLLGGALTVVPGDQLLETATTMARRIASFSPTAVRLAKQILNRIETMDLQDGYAFEQRFTVKMSGHPDSKEALLSFAEKRHPSYKPREDSWRILQA